MNIAVGLIGWRGMVGSVLMQRMHEENDFALIEPIFFSTSEPGNAAPDWANGAAPLQDAYDIETLKKLPIIISTQGSAYTEKIFPILQAEGWKGFWIDAASSLRMSDEAVLILDPVNRPLIKEALYQGKRTFVGANCTVSAMLMGLAGLFNYDLVEWMTCITYQAASGAGAQHMRELLKQFGALYQCAQALLDDPSSAILEIDRAISAQQRDQTFPHDHFSVPLAGSLIPWIDQEHQEGVTREEWKALVETNKILGRGQGFAPPCIPIDSLCVRIGAMRCHSQAVTIKLKRDMPLDEIQEIIAQSTQWTKLIPNTKEDTLLGLTPMAVSGTLTIPVGRIRKLNIGPDYLGAFTVGDQLLWGAAEPLRRMLRIILAER